MRLVYSAILAVVVGIVLVSSPLLLTGVSPTELKARAGQPESFPAVIVLDGANDSLRLVNESSSLSTYNVAASQLQPQYAVESPYSLYGVFSVLILGILAATFSYFAVKRGLRGKIQF